MCSLEASRYWPPSCLAVRYAVSLEDPAVGTEAGGSYNVQRWLCRRPGSPTDVGALSAGYEIARRNRPWRRLARCALI
ncbi:hypothetical protein HNY73_011098 [Argiope bruennichi]|uniref:Uncharacterized protein n=1 Tax=Argiope bruennichi TaxID=94029 RepID=A0A8T0F842_ARGBR|nr:hypothetical protein HNY73_011098 [Argiope bruennichi]